MKPFFNNQIILQIIIVWSGINLQEFVFERVLNFMHETIHRLNAVWALSETNNRKLSQIMLLINNTHKILWALYLKKFA